MCQCLNVSKYCQVLKYEPLLKKHNITGVIPLEEMDRKIFQFGPCTSLPALPPVDGSNPMSLGPTVVKPQRRRTTIKVSNTTTCLGCDKT